MPTRVPQRLRETARRLDPKRLILVAEVLQREGRLGEALKILASAESKARSGGFGALYRLEFLRGDTLARMNRFLLAVKTFEAVEDVARAREWRKRLQQLRRRPE